MKAGWIGCCVLLVAMGGCDGGNDDDEPDLPWEADSTPTADMADVDSDQPDMDVVDAAPMPDMAPEDTPGDLWRGSLSIAEAGGLAISVQLEVWFADDGSAFDRVLARAVSATDTISEPIGEVTDVAIDGEGAFEMDFGSMTLPAEFNPAGIPVEVTLTLTGRIVSEDFWCGDVRGSVPLLMAELTESTFGAAPWPSPAVSGCMGEGPGPDGAFIGGDDRPAEVLLPSDYDPERAYPLLMSLHGYTASGRVQASYLRLIDRVEADQIILVVPDGTIDGDGERHWQGRACCGVRTEMVDDLAYLTGLVDEASERWNIDPARVFALGHSNGGFMANDLGCLARDTFRGFVSLAGSAGLERFECDGAGVAALTVHGDADPTISYEGAGWHMGAEATAERWAEQNNCAGSEAGPPLALVPGIAGDETRVLNWTDCDAPVALWHIQGGNHVPQFDDTFSTLAIRWLLDSVPADPPPAP